MVVVGYVKQFVHLRSNLINSIIELAIRIMQYAEASETGNPEACTVHACNATDNCPSKIIAICYRFMCLCLSRCAINEKKKTTHIF